MVYMTSAALQMHLVDYFGQSFYHQILIPLGVLTLILGWLARPSTTEVITPGFRKFQIDYLLAWGICVSADWLQGPYVYALYAAYGFERHQIAQLFVAGFISSGVFGCFVGSLSDRYGRKKSALAYCALYMVSCMTKHFNSYNVLLLGRVTGGMATSLLFSCFECWMVSEHVQHHSFSSGLLDYMFGMMFSVMYGVAIVSGLVAQVVADAHPFEPIVEGGMIYWGGDCSPFDVAIITLVFGAGLIIALWPENYGGDGSSSGSSSVRELFCDAVGLLAKDRRAAYLCVVVACFEGSMFAFVFNWTPALTTDSVSPPHGLIFSLFMMACMCGASFSTMVGSFSTPAWKLAGVFALAILALSIPAGVADQAGHMTLCFLAFLLFEFCCGVYFPSVGVVKSEVVPERVRSSVYNLYRVPLNLIVVCLLLGDIQMVTVFAVCAILLFIGLVANASIGIASKSPELARLVKGSPKLDANANVDIASNSSKNQV